MPPLGASWHYSRWSAKTISPAFDFRRTAETLAVNNSGGGQTKLMLFRIADKRLSDTIVLGKNNRSRKAGRQRTGPSARTASGSR